MRVRLSSLSTIIALASGCSAPSSPDGGLEDGGVVEDAQEACVPATCVSLGAECGDADDGCGGRLSCGECAPGLTCGRVTANRGSECANDSDCAIGEVCDLATERCTTECRTGPRVSIDIPAQRIALDITMDGEPLPETAEDGFALRFALVGAAPGAASLLLLYSDRTPGSPRMLRRDLAVTLGPGPHRVMMVTDSAASSFPQGYVRTLNVTPGLDRVSLDIPRVRQTFHITVGGVPLSAELVRRVSLQLWEPGSSYPWAVELAPGDMVAASPGIIERWLVPGVYDIVYAAAPGDGLPAGDATIAERVVVDGGTIDVEIPQARVRMEVTVEASPSRTAPACTRCRSERGATPCRSTSLSSAAASTPRAAFRRRRSTSAAGSWARSAPVVRADSPSREMRQVRG